MPFTWWVLFSTRFGLRLRAVGENPAAVDTAGISVTWLRYRARHLHAASCTGLAGCYMALALQRRLRQGHDRRARLHRARRASSSPSGSRCRAMFACLLFGFLDAVDPPAGHAAAAGSRYARRGRVQLREQAVPYMLDASILLAELHRQG